jgi:lactoylglutathione lyase
MAERAFPVLFARQVSTTAALYAGLGFERHSQLPPDGEPACVGLPRGAYELAVVSDDWPQQQYATAAGADHNPVALASTTAIG